MWVLVCLLVFCVFLYCCVLFFWVSFVLFFVLSLCCHVGGLFFHFLVWCVDVFICAYFFLYILMAKDQNLWDLYGAIEAHCLRPVDIGDAYG